MMSPQQKEPEEYHPPEENINSNYLEGPLEKLLKRGEIKVLRAIHILEGYSFDGFIVHMLREQLECHYIDGDDAADALRWRLNSDENLDGESNKRGRGELMLDTLQLPQAHKDIASAVAKIKGKSIEQHIADLIKDDNEAFADTRNNLTGYVKRRLEE